MDIHEHQAKALLRQYGIPVPEGQLARDRQEAQSLAVSFGGGAVLKAQIHAGGRGKAGGIQIARTPEEAGACFSQMMGMTLVNRQTGPRGRLVRALYLEPLLHIDRELYLSFLVDRSGARVTLLASTEGGMDIEAVASTAPEKLLRVSIDPVLGLTDFQARHVATALGLTGAVFRQGVAFFQDLYRLFVEKDASLAEINPMAVTTEGELLALDAKLAFDDSALFRHPEILALRDLQEEDPEEVEASRSRLNFVKLEGTIGCMVNGAGLAMATLDLLKLHGGSPANFLDVGGGATEEAIGHAFRILLGDPDVAAILVNIFGGMVRCDAVAAGILKAVEGQELRVPVVVRLEGTRGAEGRRLLLECGLQIVVADGLEDAARKSVALAGGQ